MATAELTKSNYLIKAPQYLHYFSLPWPALSGRGNGFLLPSVWPLCVGVVMTEGLLNTRRGPSIPD